VRRGAARRASSSSSGSDQSVSPRHDTDEDTEEAEGIASENVQPLVDERRQEGHSSLLLKDANSWMQTAAAKKLLERSKEGKRATYSHVCCRMPLPLFPPRVTHVADAGGKAGRSEQL